MTRILAIQIDDQVLDQHKDSPKTTSIPPFFEFSNSLSQVTPSPLLVPNAPVERNSLSEELSVRTKTWGHRVFLDFPLSLTRHEGHSPLLQKSSDDHKAPQIQSDHPWGQTEKYRSKETRNQRKENYCSWKKSCKPVEVGSLSRYLQAFINPRWLPGFLPSTVSPWTVLHSEFFATISQKTMQLLFPNGKPGQKKHPEGFKGFSSCWFQPISKISVKLDHLPK